jgi:hypothetical protein
MKSLLRLAGISGLVLLHVMLVGAQEGGQPTVPKRVFNHRAEIVSVYDKGKDHTSVVMQWQSVTEGPKEPVLYTGGHRADVRIWAGFGYPGRVLKSTPPALELRIGTDHDGESYFKGGEMPELVAVVDGEAISLGKTVLLRSKTTVGVVRTGQTTLETLAGTFTYRGLLRLTGGRKVVLKVGRLEFELRERHLEALRDLASRMAP